MHLVPDACDDDPSQPSGFFEADSDDGTVKFNIPVDKTRDLVNNTRTRSDVVAY